MTWQERFTSPTIGSLAWAADAPHRIGVVSTESGSVQAWWWDLKTGQRGVASTGGTGAEEVHVTPDGSGVVWWLDSTGDERGHWMLSPFEGEPRPVFPDLPDGWMMGISLGRARSAVGLADDTGYSIFIIDHGSEPRVVYRNPRAAGVGREWPQGGGGLSPDGRLLCVRHTEGGDLVHTAIRLVDVATDQVVGSVEDPGCAVVPVAWAPVGHRLALTRETGGFERPWIWDGLDDSLSPVEVDLPGSVVPMDWYPDGSALVVRNDHEATHALFRCSPSGDDLTPLGPAAGTITSAAVRPDGSVWTLREDGTTPPQVLDQHGVEVVRLPSPPPPRGRPQESFWFQNRSGDRIQGWLIRPDGHEPFPAILSVHGGPEYHDTDMYDARRLAYADHGLAVVMVNYRGSTGYGKDHRDVLRGNVGFPESEDICAAIDHLVGEGLVDEANVTLEGWSHGGYLATLNAGTNPDRWRAVVAGIPVGDSVAAHYECAPAIREWETSIMGGDPMEVPDLYHERNPMTYVERVTAPMLIIAGEHDSRCPLGQVMVYAHALKRLSRDVTVHLYPGGHHDNDVTEQVAITELILDFVASHSAPPGRVRHPV